MYVGKLYYPESEEIEEVGAESWVSKHLTRVFNWVFNAFILIVNWRLEAEGSGWSAVAVTCIAAWALELVNLGLNLRFPLLFGWLSLVHYGPRRYHKRLTTSWCIARMQAHQRLYKPDFLKLWFSVLGSPTSTLNCWR